MFSPLPINDNTLAPFIGVSEGSGNGLSNPFGVYQNATFAAWLNRTTAFGVGGIPRTADWSGLASSRWLMEAWGDWAQGLDQWMRQYPNHNRAFALAVPMLPDTGSSPGSSTSFTAGATEAYNSYFTTLVNNLKTYQLDKCVIRLGWEFNGNWYAWHVLHKNTDVDAHGNKYDDRPENSVIRMVGYHLGRI